MASEDYVIKRNGTKEKFSFNKILNRLDKLGNGELQINLTALVKKIMDRLYNNITTLEIDRLTAEQCAALSTTHYDYYTLAARILISNHQKQTDNSFATVVRKLHNFRDVNNKKSPILSKELFNLATKYKNELEEMIDYKRDYLIDFFGFKTLERAYLMRINKKIVERPQHMWMRVALAIHKDNLVKVKETYDGLSQKYFTHATPTLFNAGTKRQQLSSCYLLAMEDDSIKGIFNTLSDCAQISKWAGGIGLHIHNVRAQGSHIRGTNGTSNGIVPMLKVFNDTARYVDQGGGKRSGSFAMYIEPWHKDIFEFLELKKTHGDEEARARDLFYALWIPDLFMKRVKSGGKWTLFCPDENPGLSDVYGEKFEALYEKYEKDNEGKDEKNRKGKVINARDLWYKILSSQIETGTPYMLYKDACNIKSNQKNLGTIKSSNLCCEIIEYSDSKETAVCNLASIALSKFIKPPSKVIKTFKVYSKSTCNYCKMAKNYIKPFNVENYDEVNLDSDEYRKEIYEKLSGEYNKEIKSVPQIIINGEYIGGYVELVEYLKYTFDYEELHRITKVVTENLNKVIDINYYPTEKTKRSNMRHRPIGIGVQGLADAIAKLNLPFQSQEARIVNKNIFETMYHAALEKSNELAIIDGSYNTFDGSPASKGILQFDMWGVNKSNRYDWDKLKANIMKKGLRNSLLLAPMPTASTSQILGNNECFEPFTSLIYSRRTLAGEFVIINKYLMKELIELGKWNEDLKNEIIKNQGSIQNINGIPKYLKEKYKIVWELPMKVLIDMAKDRGAYIDQSQSMNLWMAVPTYDKLTSMHFYSWKSGLKTGLYYLRTQPKAFAQQFTIAPKEEEECLACGS